MPHQCCAALVKGSHGVNDWDVLSLHRAKRQGCISSISESVKGTVTTALAHGGVERPQTSRFSEKNASQRIQVCKSSETVVGCWNHPCTHAPTHPCTHAPMHPCTHAPMHPCTLAPMHPCTHAHRNPERTPGMHPTSHKTHRPKLRYHGQSHDAAGIGQLVAQHLLVPVIQWDAEQVCPHTGATVHEATLHTLPLTNCQRRLSGWYWRACSEQYLRREPAQPPTTQHPFQYINAHLPHQCRCSGTASCQ